MINKSAFFFPFCESVNQFGGPSASKFLKTFQYLSFTGYRLSDTILQGVDQCCSGEAFEVLRAKDDLLGVVIMVVDTMVGHAG